MKAKGQINCGEWKCKRIDRNYGTVLLGWGLMTKVKLKGTLVVMCLYWLYLLDFLDVS